MADRRYYEAYDLRYRQVHEKGLAWFSGAPTPVVAQVLEKYAIAPECPMLEIGCGEGNDAAFLLERGCDLLATDVSPAAVDFCRAKYPLWADRFRTLDALKDPLDQRFGFIYAVAVLHMLVPDADNPDRARVATPGGLVIGEIEFGAEHARLRQWLAEGERLIAVLENSPSAETLWANICRPLRSLGRPVANNIRPFPGNMK